MKELRFLVMHRAFESTELDERKSRKIERSIKLAKFRYRVNIEDVFFDAQHAAALFMQPDVIDQGACNISKWRTIGAKGSGKIGENTL